GVKTKNESLNAGPGDLSFSVLQGMFPYARLADDSGSPLIVSRDLRDSFKSSAVEQGLLDWNYNPLREIGSNPSQSNSTDLRLNFGIDFKLSEGWSISGLY
ncbi:hypothetical protein ACWKSR_10985, partial [Campylobacter fetus subsp. venerealis]